MCYLIWTNYFCWRFIEWLTLTYSVWYTYFHFTYVFHFLVSVAHLLFVWTRWWKFNRRIIKCKSWFVKTAFAITAYFQACFTLFASFDYSIIVFFILWTRTLKCYRSRNWFIFLIRISEIQWLCFRIVSWLFKNPSLIIITDGIQLFSLMNWGRFWYLFCEINTIHKKLALLWYWNICWMIHSRLPQ